jgi:hypothetical protein
LVACFLPNVPKGLGESCEDFRCFGCCIMSSAAKKCGGT